MKASKSGFYEHLGRKKPNAQIEHAFTVGDLVFYDGQGAQCAFKCIKLYCNRWATRLRWNTSGNTLEGP